MAPWDRHGEAAKYDANIKEDANVNTRHVGESLRTISMDERIEERRKMKENQKKGPVSMDLSESEEEAEPPKPAEVKQPDSSSDTAGAKQVDITKGGETSAADVALIEDSRETAANDPYEVLNDDDVVVENVVTEVVCATVAGGVVEDLDAVAPRKRIRPSAGGKEKSKSPPAKSPSQSPVTDLETDLVVELDLDSQAAAASARKARRKSAAENAILAKAASKQSRVHVLE